MKPEINCDDVRVPTGSLSPPATLSPPSSPNVLSASPWSPGGLTSGSNSSCNVVSYPSAGSQLAPDHRLSAFTLASGYASDPRLQKLTHVPELNSRGKYLSACVSVYKVLFFCLHWRFERSTFEEGRKKERKKGIFLNSPQRPLYVTVTDMRCGLMYGGCSTAWWTHHAVGLLLPHSLLPPEIPAQQTTLVTKRSSLQHERTSPDRASPPKQSLPEKAHFIREFLFFFIINHNNKFSVENEMEMIIFYSW